MFFAAVVKLLFSRLSSSSLPRDGLGAGFMDSQPKWPFQSVRVGVRPSLATALAARDRSKPLNVVSASNRRVIHRAAKQL